MLPQLEFELTDDAIIPGQKSEIAFRLKDSTILPASIATTRILSVQVSFFQLKNILVLKSGDLPMGANPNTKGSFVSDKCYFNIQLGLKGKPPTINELLGKEFGIGNILINTAGDLPEPPALTFKFFTSATAELQNVLFESVILQISDKKPEITHLKIYPSILRGGSAFSISGKCTDITSLEITYGNGVSIPLGNPLSFKNNECEFTVPHQLPDTKTMSDMGFSGGIHQIDICLWARLNDITVLTTSTVTYIADGSWHFYNNIDPIVSDTASTESATQSTSVKVMALVQNEFENKIWAIAERSQEAGSFHLWNSNDGLVWNPAETAGKGRISVPAKYIHCPALFLNRNLYFVCGSMIDPNQCSNGLYEINIQSGHGREINPQSAMEACSLHACVVFPYTDGGGTYDNIWVIGGVNEYGNSLGSVWRFNGSDWRNVNTEKFPARCMHSATVQKDSKGKSIAIWTMGGANMYEGDCLYDIWTYNPVENKWSAIANNTGGDMIFSANDVNIFASSVIFTNTFSSPPSLLLLRNYQENDDSFQYGIGMSRLKHERLQQFGSVKKDVYSLTRLAGAENGLGLAPVNDRMYVINFVNFNGCVWVMGISYSHKNRFKLSDVYYACL